MRASVYSLCGGGDQTRAPESALLLTEPQPQSWEVFSLVLKLVN